MLPVLKELAPDLWIADQPLRFFGLPIGSRMTIVRCDWQRLLLHSPVAHSRELVEAVDRIGVPAFVVAPNRFHHLHAREWQCAYPTARLFAAPGLGSKRPDLKIDAVLDGSYPPDWPDAVEQVLVEGFPLVNEVVLFHRASRTLIATDLLFNIGPESPVATQLAFRMSGSYGRPASTILEKLFVRDRAAFRASLERILMWPFTRIVVAHGAIVENGGRAALEDAYAWVLR